MSKKSAPPQMVYSHAAQLYSAGRLPEAARYTGSMLRQYPNDVFLLNLMGGIFAARNAWPEALKYYRKAAQKAPRDVQVLQNLSMAQQSTGNLDGAEKTLRKALKIRPDFAAGWRMLGQILQQRFDNKNARACFEKALALKPDFIEAAADILLETEHSNDLDALRQHLADMQGRFGDHPIYKLFHGVLRFREKDYKAARDILAGLSFSTRIQDRQREFELLRVHTLAKTDDKLGDFRAAFDGFEKMNALCLQSTPPEKYNAGGFQARQQDHLDYFTPETVAGWPAVDAGNDSPVFMVGFPRSGTTLLDTFLRGHKDITVLEETPLVAALVTKLGIHNRETLECLGQIDAKTLRAAAADYQQQVRKTAGGDFRVVIDRNPFNTTFIGELARIFPKGKFILALRDPADVVLSSFMQNFVINDANATLTTPLEAAKTYDATMRLWVRYNELFPLDGYILRYEDLVADAADALPPLVDFLGLEWDPAMLDHRKTAGARERINTASYAQVVQPIYKSALRRWENYAEFMPEALEILAPWREYFGYE